jgi:hypothetical protein
MSYIISGALRYLIEVCKGKMKTELNLKFCCKSPKRCAEKYNHIAFVTTCIK